MAVADEFQCGLNSIAAAEQPGEFGHARAERAEARGREQARVLRVRAAVLPPVWTHDVGYTKPKRANVTVKSEKPIKLYVFDADGTLRGCTVPGQPCPNRPGEWELLPNVKERLAQIEWDERAGPHFAIATNQGGAGLGYFTAADARRLVEDLVESAFGRAAPPGSIEICTHAPYAGCACRKPKGEMIRRLMRRFRARPDETLFVGDTEADGGAARDAGCRFRWAHEFFGRGAANKPAEASGAGDEECAADGDSAPRG